MAKALTLEQRVARIEMYLKCGAPLVELDTDTVVEEAPVVEATVEEAPVAREAY